MFRLSSSQILISRNIICFTPLYHFVFFLFPAFVVRHHLLERAQVYVYYCEHIE